MWLLGSFAIFTRFIASVFSFSRLSSPVTRCSSTVSSEKSLREAFRSFLIAKHPVSLA